jgi:hypothetical protein
MLITVAAVVTVVIVVIVVTASLWRLMTATSIFLHARLFDCRPLRYAVIMALPHDISVRREC